MAELDGKTGVWRTVGGRRIFIRDGEDLASAMKKSGKFKSSKSSSGSKNDEKWNKFFESMKRKGLLEIKNMSSLSDDNFVDKLNMEELQMMKELGEARSYKEIQNLVREKTDGSSSKTYYNKEKDDTVTRKDIQKNYDKYGKSMSYDKYEEKVTNSLKNSGWEEKTKVDKNDINALNKIADNYEDINKYDGLDDTAKDYIKNRRNEMSTNKRISDFNKSSDKVREKSLNNKLYANDRYLDDGKEIHEVYRQMDAREMQAFAKEHPEGIEKMKAYLRDKDDYDLYVRARNYPESIDAMTENSTDWEALEKKYSARYDRDQEVNNQKIADVMLRGEQRSLEFERQGLEKAKRNGNSVEDISHRTKRVHELELSVQEYEYARNRAYRTSYEKYMKEHPGSTLSIEDFIELKKKK